MEQYAVATSAAKMFNTSAHQYYDHFLGKPGKGSLDPSSLNQQTNHLLAQLFIILIIRLCSIYTMG